MAGGTPPVQDGRSGYWRLFYTQLQEEALKEYDRKKQLSNTETLESGKQVTETPKVAKPPVKLEPLVKLDVYETPNFKRKPIYTEPTPVAVNLPAFVAGISLELSKMYQEFAPLVRAQNIRSIEVARAKRQQRTRRRAAAFLLLAA